MSRVRILSALSQTQSEVMEIEGKNIYDIPTLTYLNIQCQAL